MIIHWDCLEEMDKLTEEAIREHAKCILWNTVWIAIEEVKEAMSEILDITFQTFLVYMIRQKYKWEE